MSGAAGGFGGVEGGEVADDDAGGPTVGHEVVNRENEYGLVGREREQRGAEQRRAGEVEGLGGFGAEAVGDGGFAGVGVGE